MASREIDEAVEEQFRVGLVPLKGARICMLMCVLDVDLLAPSWELPTSHLIKAPGKSLYQVGKAGNPVFVIFLFMS